MSIIGQVALKGKIVQNTFRKKGDTISSIFTRTITQSTEKSLR